MPAVALSRRCRRRFAAKQCNGQGGQGGGSGNHPTFCKEARYECSNSRQCSSDGSNYSQFHRKHRGRNRENDDTYAKQDILPVLGYPVPEVAQRLHHRCKCGRQTFTNRLKPLTDLPHHAFEPPRDLSSAFIKEIGDRTELAHGTAEVPIDAISKGKDMEHLWGPPRRKWEWHAGCEPGRRDRQRHTRAVGNSTSSYRQDIVSGDVGHQISLGVDVGG